MITKTGGNMDDARPDYVARAVKNVDGKDRWTDIGIAYQNRRSITILLSYFVIL
jgi:hypothetical protein